jgi:hypothetical protein
MVVEEAGGAWNPASQIVAPSNTAANPEVLNTWISCATSLCVITAQYIDNAGAREAMVADESGGVWGSASEIQLPANAATNPEVAFRSACTASGACVLIGEYRSAGNDREAMVAEEVGGLWGRAREVAAPANAATNPEIIFGEVQCPALGSCVAFGEYTNRAGATRDMEVAGITAPENTAAPVLGGGAKVGEALTCSEGAWAPSPTSYTYRWLRDGAAIAAAESSVYTVTAADEGHSISCEVTATNAVGSKSAVSGNSVVILEEARERREAEEAAAVKRRQEEANASLDKSREVAKAAATGSVSLDGSVLSIQSGGKGSVKLICTGTATCAGKLTLMVTGKHGKKAKAETIGTAAFSIPAGKIGHVVTITLTATGRALLKADHGKLGAILTIVKSSPAPTSTARASVQLVREKAAKAKRRKR